MAHGSLALQAHVVPSAPVLSVPAQSLTEPGLLILDGDVRAGLALVLTTNEIGDLLVLGLLDSRLCSIILASEF